MGEEKRDRKIKKRKKGRRYFVLNLQYFIFSMLFNSRIYKDISQINLILYDK